MQGEKPTHPELLDWLAREFVESGWDVKHLHRLIVTSATYRQSSQVTPGMAERDPENRLLARGPRYRLPSWMLRDQALAVSGLLVEKVGGPPVKPISRRASGRRRPSARSSSRRITAKRSTAAASTSSGGASSGRRCSSTSPTGRTAR